MSTKYPHLFSPIVLGNQLFRNRIFNSPTGLEIDPEQYTKGYYERKAIGGAASVCIGDACPSINGRTRKSQINLWDDTEKQKLTDIAQSITRHGAVASMEILHAGNCSYYSADAYGAQLYGPVDGISPFGHEIKEMPEEMILQIIEEHAKAALYAKMSGYGMVTIHGGHGWLITQFLSHENKRTDKWGGTPEGRARLAIAIIDRIHQVCGPKYPVEIRIVGDEVYEGGYHIEEGITQAQLLSGHADLIHVSTGSHEVNEVFTITHPNMFLADGCNVHYAAEIKKHVKDTPIATVGALSEPELMEEIIASGQADVVEMARGLICDPDMPLKLQTGHDDEVRKCMRCLWCFSHHMFAATINCAINPEIGHEYEHEMINPPKVQKKILVAGGGIAGMEAALTAADRGHSVVLCEKGDRLGGALLCEEKVPFKEKLDQYINLQRRKIEREPNIEVKLNCEVTPETAAQVGADAIICALGAEPIKPAIPGIDGANVFQAEELYVAPEKAGDNVVILGAGLVGMELAIYLSMLGKKCTIVEMAPAPNDGGNCLHGLAISTELKKYGIHISTSTKAVEIKENGVLCEFTGVPAIAGFRFGMPEYPADGTEGTKFYEADTIAYAVGMRPRWAAADAIRDSAPEFYQVGDCVMPKNIWQATTQGHYAARDIGRM